MQSVTLSIILPVHNESAVIKKVVTNISTLMKGKKISYEIICIENGSTDESYSLLQSLQKQLPHIIVKQSAKGWGNAVKKGLNIAGGTYICYMVSDGQIDPKSIIRLYNTMQKNPNILVKIYREKRESSMRFWNSKIFNVLSTSIFQIQSRDINATPKMFPKKIIESENFISPNVSFDLELLLFCKKKQIKFLELPTKSEKRLGGTSTTKVKTVWEMLRYMIYFRFRI